MDYQIYGIQDAADEIGVTRITVRAWINEGKARAYPHAPPRTLPLMDAEEVARLKEERQRRKSRA